MVTVNKKQTVNENGCRVASPSLLSSVVMKEVLASILVQAYEADIGNRKIQS